MNALKKNWWKISLAVILGLVLDMFLHAVSPTGGIELVPSTFSQTIALIPAITLLLATLFAVIAIIFVLMQEGLTGQKWVKGLRYGLAIGGLWIVGFFELGVVSVEPWRNALAWALEDAIPIILMSVLLASMTATDNAAANANAAAKKTNDLTIPFIALALLVGRYFVYVFLQPHLGYWPNPLATFGWTLVLGLTVGMMYWLLASGLKGQSPLRRALWFAGVVFGLNWWLYNIFVPVLFQAPSTFMMEMVTTRVIVDIVFVLLGIFAFERGLALKSNSETEPSRVAIP
jgi:hypothetical protein